MKRFEKFATLMLLMTLGASPPLRAADSLRPGEMTLPLKEYLALVETVERLDRERALRQASREEPLAEVTAQRVRVAVREGTADVTTELEVLVQGEPKGPVLLPVAGVPVEIEARTISTASPAATSTAVAAVTAGAKAGELWLVAPGPGRYAVKVTGRIAIGQGVNRFVLPGAVAPVAVTEVEMPADLAFDAPGAVIVDDRTEGGRRRLQLTTRRGEAQTLEVRRKVDGSEAEKLLAQSVVLTLVQLLPDGPRRHDVILYEVSRGGLGSFTVDLPPGLAVEQAGTDEGTVVPVVESRRLTINRRSQLRGTGYLVLTSTPAPGAEVPLEPVVPAAAETDVRARYLALASAVAADAHPLPQDSWSRVDLDDLPPALREALSSIDLAAAWRLGAAATGGKMAVALLPPAPSLPLVVKQRLTTTLLTVDGTLLHRDRLTLRPPAGLGASLDVVLPATARLWSARVDEVPVRPLDRGNGTISIPLGFESGKEPVVEIVSVLEKAIPAGRSELVLTLPQLAVPVQAHLWRVLLPDGPKYRFRSGELRPARPVVYRPAPPAPRAPRGAARQPSAEREPWSVLQSAPGVLTDRINVGGNESGQQSQFVGLADEKKEKDLGQGALPHRRAAAGEGGRGDRGEGEALAALLVQPWAADLHVPQGLFDLREAEGAVQLVGVASDEREAAQPLEVRVGQDALHEPASQAVAAHLRQHVDVAEVGEGGAVGHHPRQADLPRALVEAEAEGIRKRPRHGLAGNPHAPVGGGKEGVNGVEVESRRIGGDGEAVAVVLGAHDGGILFLLCQIKTAQVRPPWERCQKSDSDSCAARD